MKPSDNIGIIPCYDISFNPPYQIDYCSKHAGKHISASKRRVTFQFGFSSAEAVASGLVEGDCRGDEHEVVLVWSHVTGKRQLFVDSREIHASKAARGNTRFEHSWNAFGCHVMKITANGTPLKGSSGGRQFDLELDGMSFFDFSKIYELGHGATNRSSNTPSLTYSYSGMACYASYNEEVKEEERPMPQVKINIVDLLDSQPPTPIVSVDHLDQSQSSTTSPASDKNCVPSLVSFTLQTSTASYDEFLPVEYNNEKPFQTVLSEIMYAYKNKATNVGKPSFASSSCRALVPISEEDMDPIVKSMKNIVNFDDITAKPIKPKRPNSHSLDTMKRVGTNRGLEGRAPTLSEIHDSFIQSPPVPAKEVMKTHPGPQFYPPQPQTFVAHQGTITQSLDYHHGSPSMRYASAF